VNRKLVVEDGRRERQLQLVSSIVVGRDPSCDVSDDADTLLSRRHAEFTVGAGGVQVRDLGSRNGTFVNGTRIAEATIRSGDVVAIGRLRVRYTDDAPAPAEVPAEHITASPHDTRFDGMAVQDASDPMPDAAVSSLPQQAAVDDGALSRFVIIEVAFLAAVVFVAVAAAAVWRTFPAGAVAADAGGVGWLIPPAVVAAIAAGGVAWRINRRLTRLMTAGTLPETAAAREGVGAIDTSRGMER
jgi:hypothetical protein